MIMQWRFAIAYISAVAMVAAAYLSAVSYATPSDSKPRGAQLVSALMFIAGSLAWMIVIFSK